jgi:pilus assembly protein CpaB
MNNRALTLSLVMAVLAVVFVQSYVSSIEDEAKRRFGTEVLVVLAKRDIREMETVNETMLELKHIPKRFLEPAAIFFEKREEDKEVTRSLKGLSGTVAVVPIKKGEQFSYNKLTEPNMRTGLAPQVAPNRRAVSFPINDVTGVSKLVKPGDRVDLIAVLQAGPGKDSRIARTVLQDVVILATGRAVTHNVARVVEADAFSGKERIRSLADDASFSTVTVEVEPAQAQLLSLIATNNESQLVLSLRNNDDTDRLQLPASTVDDVIGTEGQRVRALAGVRK